MNSTSQLEEALALALKLAPKERLQLIEQIASSVEREIEAHASGEEQPVIPAKTGAEIVAMLETMEPIEFVDPDIEDPVEWVKAQRRKRANQLKPYRDGDQ